MTDVAASDVAASNAMDAGGSSALQLIRAQCALASPPEVDALVDALRAKFGATVAAVLFYGSGRRGGDLRAGVIDL